MSMGDDFYSLFDQPQHQPDTNVTVLPTPTGADHPYALAALRGEAGSVTAAVTGHRNDALNRAYFNMGRHIAAGTISQQTVIQVLATAARATGLPEKEIETCLRVNGTSASAQAAAKAGPRTPTPLPELPVLTVIAEPDNTLVADFWQARPILAHLHDFARARCVAPWAVLGNAMARVICATHPSVAIPPIVGGYASLNLFVGIVGRSGSGKGAAEAVAREAVDVGVIETRNTGSGEGAVHAYMKRTKEGLEQHTTAVLFSIPEIDTLGAVGARQGATLMPLLRSGWSGEQLGFQYADPVKNLLVPAHRYRMCLVAGIQPGRAGTLLDDADGGTPQRFLWLPATDPDAPVVPPPAPAPIAWSMNQPIYVGANGLRPFDVCATARELIVSERQKGLRGDGDALDGHGLLTRLKTAAALALFEKRWEVTDEDWELAGVIAAKSDATRTRVIAHRQAELAKVNTARALAEADRAVMVGDTVAERAVARVARGVLRRLDEAGDMPHSVARKALRSSDRGYFEEAVDHLVRSGQVAVEDLPNGSVLRRPGVKP